jgi:hypothetical protein
MGTRQYIYDLDIISDFDIFYATSVYILDLVLLKED